MIDIHSHIIYGIDDGASDMEMSVKMADMAEKDGITDVIATPHINEFINLEDIRLKLNLLQRKIYEGGLNLKLHEGGEIPFGMLSEKYEPVRLCNSEFILVEFFHGQGSVPQYAKNMFRSFLKKGYKIIIAHPERNLVFLKNKERLIDLLLPGVYLQLTAMSFQGGFGKNVRIFSEELMKEEMVDFIATDSHDHISRKPQLSFLLESERYRDYHKALDKILNFNPDMIFSNL
ncbi:MAG: tyrosine protein phosphatase [Desulfobacteraceae bacterium]|nr:tyrosine protein phosphatase [Desulfobacteraceae bacterium]